MKKCECICTRWLNSKYVFTDHMIMESDVKVDNTRPKRFDAMYRIRMTLLKEMFLAMWNVFLVHT